MASFLVARSAVAVHVSRQARAVALALRGAAAPSSFALAGAAAAAAPSAFALGSVAPSRGARSTASELRNGDLIEMEGGTGGVWRVMSSNFVRQAMGRAFIQLELRSIKLGTKKNVRMRTEEEVEKVSLDPPQRLQVLYWDAEKVSFMDSTTFEQTELPLSVLGDPAQFLQEGMIVTVEMYQGQPAIVHMPMKAVFEVKEVTPMPGNSQNEGRDIPAVLSNGVRIKVPKFTKAGDRIVIDIAQAKYLGKE
jgi:elongation factor P